MVELAGRDAGRDLDHLDEAARRVVPRDVPDCVVELGVGDEDAILLREAGLGQDQDRVPAVDPVRLAHRAQEREHFRHRAVQALLVRVGDAIGGPDIHGLGGRFWVPERHNRSCSILRSWLGEEVSPWKSEQGAQTGRAAMNDKSPPTSPAPAERPRRQARRARGAGRALDPVHHAQDPGLRGAGRGRPRADRAQRRHDPRGDRHRVPRRRRRRSRSGRQPAPTCRASGCACRAGLCRHADPGDAPRASSRSTRGIPRAA